METIVETINLPNYRVEDLPDFQSLGAQLDAFIVRHFPKGKLALRGISLKDHPALSLDDLVSKILDLGTDRYDPERKGVLHDFYAPYQIELHALPCELTDTLISTHCSGSVMTDILKDFYHGPPQDRNGEPLRVDILSMYDRAQLLAVHVDYGYTDQQEPCEFRFISKNKRSALIGVIKIL